MRPNKKYSIIGAGTFGSALAQKLQTKGLLNKIYARSDNSYINIKDKISENNIIRILENIVESDNIIIAVKDNSLNDLIKELIAYELDDKLIMHCSGVLKKEVLVNLKQKGAKIAAAHPFQTFYIYSKTVFDNVPWGIDCDTDLYDEIADFVHSTDGKPIDISNIDTKQKALYHLSAVLASNISVILMQFAKSTSDAAGIDAKEFFPKIIETTINNVYESWQKGAEMPLTGPFARGDVNAVSLHQKALAEAGLDDEIYSKLADIAAKTALEHGFINKDQYSEMKKITNGET